jgi:hypothetical protein
MSKFECPSCGDSIFLEGPHGGMAVNFCCATCWMRFNDMGPLGIKRSGFVAHDEKHLFRGDYVPGSLAAFTIFARSAVEAGAMHDCIEWQAEDGKCAVCGRQRLH